MNYESSPFQGYSSISVDDLKDQANSLLNLVTEEQRPLRVFMNNSKEFFLFPQDMLAPISDSDFRLILLSAMRYAMRRKTHMSSVVADYLKRHSMRCLPEHSRLPAPAQHPLPDPAMHAAAFGRRPFCSVPRRSAHESPARRSREQEPCLFYLR